MTSIKKLFTVAVEDKFSSDDALILKAAQDACDEYAASNNWKDAYIEKSVNSTKRIEDTIIHYFDIYGMGNPIAFEDPYVNAQPAAKQKISAPAAKEIAP